MQCKQTTDHLEDPTVRTKVKLREYSLWEVDGNKTFCCDQSVIQFIATLPLRIAMKVQNIINFFIK